MPPAVVLAMDGWAASLPGRAAGDLYAFLDPAIGLEEEAQA